jgi:replicative DNA helicase
MSEIQLDSRIQQVGVVATEAFAEMAKLQKGTKLLLRTGEEMLDCHLGTLLPGDCVLIAGAPSSGKSETLYRMIEKIMSKEVNPNAENFVSLEFSMEMKMLNKLLRTTHNLLGKKKSKILFEEFNEEESEKVKKYYESLQDNRRFVVQSPVTPEDFYKMTRDFCIKHKDADSIILSADHILLFVGSDKQAVLEKISEFINLLKLEFNNVYFLLLSQINRIHSGNIKEKSNDMMPNNSWIFGSSFMEQLASYIIIITNPFKQSVTQYLKVSKERYDYLDEFFGEEDKNGRISFNTISNLFYFVTKVRESDSPWRDLFVKKMDLTSEQIEKMKQSIEPKQTATPFQTPTFNTTPVFEKTVSEIVPPISFDQLSSVFGDGDTTPPF